MATPPVKPLPSLPPMELPESIQPAYSNAARITHFVGEFIFDFAQMMPGIPAPKVVSRVVTSPVSAKALYRALGENLKNYEKNFGEIKLPAANGLAGELFKHIHPGDGTEGEVPEDKGKLPEEPL